MIATTNGIITPGCLDSPLADRQGIDSPTYKLEARVRSPVIKRTTPLKGMGKFCKITNKKLIKNAISNVLLSGSNWKNE